MVASGRPEPSPDAGGEYAALVARLDSMQRDIDELGRQSKFPFSVGHTGGVKDFSITPSNSGDGTADLFIGDGAGNPAIRTRTVTGSAFKIVEIFDAAGRLMLSTDSLTGFGLGNPCLPFLYGGKEPITIPGSTSAGTATEIGLGRNLVWNPCLYLQPQIRFISPTAATVKVFAVFTGPATTYTTSERTIAVPAANSAVVGFYEFAVYLAALDIQGTVSVSIKAYVSSGTPGDVNIRMTPFRGGGVSKGFADQNLQAAL